MSLGMASLVAHRLVLMSSHRAALNAAAAVGDGQDNKGGSVKGNHRNSCPPPTRGGVVCAGSTKAAGAVSVGGEVMESGVFLLALEASAMLWVVGGWSSLVALRFR